jgi:ectoine hydroxylase-related dioxygenase (phytanoyl-CoA dioxygenase family)
MIETFGELTTENALSLSARTALQEQGYVVLPGIVPADRLGQLSDSYNAAVESATGNDIKVGTTSTRVTDFVNRGAEYDNLYAFPSLLEAGRLVIGGPFKLSSFQSRTLRPGAASQGLHVDVERGSPDWPLLGFILMIDEFRTDNGATCFVPGSHRRSDVPADAISKTAVAETEQVAACGAAGSMLVFNGSAWHGHGTNSSTMPRRSLQGAFIPRNGRAGTDFGSRMQPETRTRLSPLAQYLLAL